ncbi:MAG: hypothetical protein HLUCCO07_06805 [Rhodobacteraceae bacterium HLUCCO07]|nr:MAG: hypothetical protein HLUCCO07_06805 [Rhodobacteraceae bacterium HLUCCO07]
MPDRKRIITIGGTLFAIAGIGFFMQNGQSGPGQAAMNKAASDPVEILDISSTEPTAADTRETSEVEASSTANPTEAEATPDTALMDSIAEEPAPEVETSTSAGDDPAIPNSKQAQARKEAAQTIFESAALDDPVITVAPEVTPENSEASTDQAIEGPDETQTCDPEMKVETVAAALVNVSIHAECLPNERVTLEHAEMVFTEATDAEGKLEVTIPALVEDARITATFVDDHAVSASATVSSLEFYDRAVIQSSNDSAVTLHALEYGAEHTDRGHIWSEATGGIENAATGKGGFLITLGDPSMDNARVAQVYSFPTGIAQEEGQVELSVEIEVTDRNCGRTVDAKAMQRSAAGELDIKSLSLTMPDCDAIGDLLVLKNLVNDLKVARN